MRDQASTKWERAINARSDSAKRRLSAVAFGFRRAGAAAPAGKLQSGQGDAENQFA